MHAHKQKSGTKLLGSMYTYKSTFTSTFYNDYGEHGLLKAFCAPQNSIVTTHYIYTIVLHVHIVRVPDSSLAQQCQCDDP